MTEPTTPIKVCIVLTDDREGFELFELLHNPKPRFSKAWEGEVISITSLNGESDDEIELWDIRQGAANYPSQEELLKMLYVAGTCINFVFSDDSTQAFLILEVLDE